MRFIYSLMLIAFIGCTGESNEAIITVNELQEQIKTDEVMLVSTQTFAQFDSAHIPGSVHVFYKKLNNDVPVSGMLKSIDELVSIFEDKGISRKKMLVIYDQGAAKHAGRMFWAFKYVGFDDVRMLNGNFDAWTKAGNPVTSEKLQLGRIDMIPKIQPQLKVQMAEVKSKLESPKTLIIDVRSPAEYNGTDERSEGHIPGAINLPHSHLLDNRRLVKTKAEIESILSDNNITMSNEIILYCNTSTRAGLVFLVLNSVMDYPNVRVYDGAYEEWSQMGNEIEH